MHQFNSTRINENEYGTVSDDNSVSTGDYDARSNADSATEYEIYPWWPLKKEASQRNINDYKELGYFNEGFTEEETETKAYTVFLSLSYRNFGKIYGTFTNIGYFRFDSSEKILFIKIS